MYHCTANGNARHLPAQVGDVSPLILVDYLRKLADQVKNGDVTIVDLNVAVRPNAVPLSSCSFKESRP